VIIKHNNPCGVALGKNIKEAYQKALETDAVSAFGGVLGFNQIVDDTLAGSINEGFVEAILAPGFTEEAMKELKKKKNLIILSTEFPEQKDSNTVGFDLKKIEGGVLIQEPDHHVIRKEDLKVVTQRKPSPEEMESLLFAWTVAKHVKSNAIVLVLAKETAGIGAGQMSRVDSVKIAIMKAQKQLKGSVMASDAFFPFRDGIDVAADAGVKAVIQPGGSIRDNEIIRACDEKGIAMVLTAVRHFKH
jgi:phosphoribosylaminoimidazolecarboxamide formyltransferase/IMP cyclohydrolase